jgi:hypothetical protein
LGIYIIIQAWSAKVDYVKVEDARDKPGLRLALTMGVPGPWSQAAKYVFEYKGIALIPVG